DPSRSRAAMTDAGAARLGFSFARDVPKGAAAVRELVATGTLRIPDDRPLRVLDLGAGLGATTWGLARALDAHGARGALDATWLDTDAPALDLGAALVRARQAERSPSVRLEVRTRVGPVGRAGALGRFDVVLVGQVLSELDVALTEDERRDRHAELLAGLVRECLEPDGAVVVVEPALRDRTRHLHRVRDALLAGAGVALFAPCLHEAPCPALVRESDWCHEDLGVDLPAWLAPVARAAGLRHEGLTFSYLVLRRGGPRLVDTIGRSATGARLRVVSEPMRTKGKREAFVCGELIAASALRDEDDDPAGPHAPVEPELDPPPFLAAGRVRLMRLDRDAHPGNAAWEAIARGDLIAVVPAPRLDRPRMGSGTTVARVELGAPVHSIGPAPAGLAAATELQGSGRGSSESESR
ncbi:MAG TPA: small ribosomal subunit Rsm22 family protein, partial [Polyangiaceae bacterium]|nr:small ribosomal subunit Rsm22 family protein [Polyangiaceae bacterium]